ncbi:hypothetical protein [Sulfurimonas sp.]
MDKYRIVCEEANIQLRGAQKMERENPSKFYSMLLAGYCNKIGFDSYELESYFNAGVTKDEIKEAIFKLRQQKEDPYRLSFDDGADASREVVAVNQRVNMELESYTIDGVHPLIIDIESPIFELNIKEPHPHNKKLSKKYSTFYDEDVSAGVSFNRKSLKTVSFLKNEILKSLEQSGYSIKKTPIVYEKITIDMKIEYDIKKDCFRTCMEHGDFYLTIEDSGDIWEYKLGDNIINIKTEESPSFYYIFELCKQFFDSPYLEKEERDALSCLSQEIYRYHKNNLFKECSDVEYAKEIEEETVHEILGLLSYFAEEIVKSEEPMFFNAIEDLLDQGFERHMSSYVDIDKIKDTRGIFKATRQMQVLQKTQKRRYRKQEMLALITEAIEEFRRYIKAIEDYAV